MLNTVTDWKGAEEREGTSRPASVLLQFQSDRTASPAPLLPLLSWTFAGSQHGIAFM